MTAAEVPDFSPITPLPVPGWKPKVGDCVWVRESRGLWRLPEWHAREVLKVTKTKVYVSAVDFAAEPEVFTRKGTLSAESEGSWTSYGLSLYPQNEAVLARVEVDRANVRERELTDKIRQLRTEAASLVHACEDIPTLSQVVSDLRQHHLRGSAKS